MKTTKCLLMLSTLIFLFGNVYSAGNVNGRTSVQYLIYNHMFNTDGWAEGFVKFVNGFTIKDGMVNLRITESVGRGIDLRFNGILLLTDDLHLATNVTFSSNGRIRGEGNAIILDGDLIIPDGDCLHFISNAMIDGQGHDIVLGNNAQILVDSNYTLTLKNLTLKNTVNTISRPAVKCGGWNGTLALDNVNLALNDDFYFYSGQFFIYNDVVFTGSSEFVYWGVRPSYIAPHSTLFFDEGTTFDFIPSTTDSTLIKMLDSTSALHFNGCTIKSTYTGFQLTKGKVYFDNKVTITSAATLTLSDLTEIASLDYGSGWIDSVAWSPDGRFLAIGGLGSAVVGQELQVYSFDGSSLNFIDSMPYLSWIYSVSWSPDGRFLAIGGNRSVDEVIVFSFNGSSLAPVVFLDYGAQALSVCWSPSGRYLAIGGYNPGTVNHIQVYYFNGTALNYVTGRPYGSIPDSAVKSLSWSPDGRFLAIGGHESLSNNEFLIFSFDGSALSIVAEENYGDTIYSVCWSPDGRFLAIGGENPDLVGEDLQVYSFNGSSLTKMDSKDYGTRIESVSWSPDGRFLAIGGYNPDSVDEELQVYSFNGSSLTPVVSELYAERIVSACWSPDGIFLAIGGIDSAIGGEELQVYRSNFGPDLQTQALSNSIIFTDLKNGIEPNANICVLGGADISLDGHIYI
ncbi:WD40 repeat domain-containing protein [Candidatus Dependentiae bacterium]